MPNEIYHKSHWGNANAEGFGDVYFDAAATNKLYNHSDYYENSNGTDKILRDLSNKASIVLTPTAYSDGSLNTVIPTDGNGDFDFSRGSSATRVNEKGLIESIASGLPRIDYTSGFGSLLLEPSRTNSITYSEELTQWTDAGTTTVLSNITSPSGSLQSYLLSAASSNTNALRYNLSFSASTNYSYSLFFKAGTSQEVRMQIYDGSSFFRLAVNPLNNFEIVDQSGVNSYLIEDFTNGWKKVSINITTSASASSGYLQIYPDRTGNLNNVYLYGAQLEQGSYATSYIPTSGSTVTRSADVANNSGNADLFNDSEGVLFVDSAALADDGANRQMTIYGTGGNSVRLYYHTTSNTIRLLIQGGGTTKVDEIYTTGDITLFHKIAGKYKDGDTALWINGFEVETSNATLSISGLSSLNLETSSGGANVFLSKIKELAVFKEALTDAELESLTSWVSFTEMATDLEYTLE